MEFTDTSLHWGLVGDAKPKHVLPYSNNNNNIMMLLSGAANTHTPNTNNIQDDSGGNSNSIIYMRQTSVSVGTWYRTLSPMLQQVYHSLGPDGKERRVIVLLQPHFAIPSSTTSSSSSCDNNNSSTSLLPTNFKAALLQCLLHNNNNNDATGAGAGANNISVSLQSSITLVPYALPMISTAMLLIHVGAGGDRGGSSGDISCMIHAAGHSLPFTFQTILGNSSSDWANTNTTRKSSSCSTSTIIMNELILAVLKCLQACPRAARKEAIKNFVFCGQGVIHRPEFPLQVVRRVQQVLRLQSLMEEKTDDTTATATASAEPKQEQEPQDDEDDDEEPKRRNGMIHHGFGIVPVNLKELQPLAELVGLVDYVVYDSKSSSSLPRDRRRRPRPDLLAWTGASLWAWHWHNHAQNDAQFHWIGK
jgi:hypothetical protein